MSENIGENPNDTTFGDANASGPNRAHKPLSTAVINAVADAAGVKPAQLEVPLYDRVDPDALDNLFSNRHDGAPRGSGHVVFTMLDYEVTVYSDGRVVVRQ